MIESGIAAMIGLLSHDLIMVCDAQHVVRETNGVVGQVLGRQVVGLPFLALLPEMAQSKGQAFLEHLQQIPVGARSDTWELLFTMSQPVPLPISVRAGWCDQQTWVLVGTREPPHATALYHKVLAMNSELTNLIRQLSKEQARLNVELLRLAETQEQFHG